VPELLVVAQPSADGQACLPGVVKEVDLIQDMLSSRVAVTSLVSQEATVEKVIKGIQNTSWAHFACHGKQDRTHPTESALLLAGDTQLTLSHISDLNLANKDMAFLSACQTAQGDEELSDEAVHLAAGMLTAGYRGVIATMWSVGDEDAPKVARDVYGHIFNKQGGPDPREAAVALARAVERLRVEEKAPFLSWVPYIHLGV
jgi:CHAT domain-containing protein